MSVRCNDCGAVAGYGYEIGHKSDCPSLKRLERMRRRQDQLVRNLPDGDDADCTTGPPLDDGESSALTSND